MLPGFKERMDLCLSQLLHTPIKCLVAPGDGIWQGASTLAALPLLKSIMITQQEFSEHGQSALYRNGF
jgi:actin-related protein